MDGERPAFGAATCGGSSSVAGVDRGASRHDDAADDDAIVPGVAAHELWGDVVVAGSAHRTETAMACCDACRKTDGCNVWVWCEDGDVAGSNACRADECWLKWQANPRAPAVMAHGVGTPWRAGTLAKSFARPMTPVAPYTGSGDPGVLTLSWAAAGAGGVAHGGTGDTGAAEEYVVRIRLRPDWSPNSAAWARQVAGAQLCGAWCTFYRAEPVPDSWAIEGFYGPPYALLQGGLRPGPPAGAVPDNVADAANKRRYPVMRRGMVAWAGGGLGPDFFIALGDHPEWGTGHVVGAVK